MTTEQVNEILAFNTADHPLSETIAMLEKAQAYLKDNDQASTIIQLKLEKETVVAKLLKAQAIIEPFNLLIANHLAENLSDIIEAVDINSQIRSYIEDNLDVRDLVQDEIDNLEFEVRVR